MKAIIIALFAISMSGCASDTAVLRVVDYGTGGAVGIVTGQVGGCAVHQQPGKPFASVQLHYKGERCEVVVQSEPKK